MIATPDIVRPSRDLVEGLAEIGSATASGELSRLGIRSAHLQGLTNLQKIYLHNTQITEAGLAQLHKALPSCSIYWP